MLKLDEAGAKLSFCTKAAFFQRKMQVWYHCNTLQTCFAELLPCLSFFQHQNSGETFHLENTKAF